MRDSPLPPFVSDGESTFDSLRALRDEARGGPRVCVAVLDGPVDLDHPCFADADLTRVDTTLDDAPGAGAMSTHGTHVASVIFGRPQTGALGLAADCRGLLLTVFRDRSGYLSQLDLARAIERAVLEGAQVINVSGGERAPLGAADPILERALGLCEESGAVLIAAAGNDGCDCVHVPAALSPAIAVGAMDREGVPVASSNVGEAYQRNGVLAPGEQIPGAAPGGGVVRMTGSSFATPLVSSLAALLLSIQMREGAPADARAIRAAILDSALPCPASAAECERYLAGTLNVPGAHALTRRGGRSIVAEFDEGITSEAGVATMQHPPPEAAAVAGSGVGASAAPAPDDGGSPAAALEGAAHEGAADSGALLAPSAEAPGGVEPACGCGSEPCTCGAVASAASALPVVPAPVSPVPVPTPAPVVVGPAPLSLVYAIGSVGFDFGTEARRDTFRQLMPEPEVGEPPVRMAANPYDTTQLADYLDARPWESTSLIWTMNLELTPIYALEAEPEYAEAVYEVFRTALRNQSLPPEDDEFVSRVSIPGVLTSRTVRLFSGQVVPVVVVQRRGLYIWNEHALVDAVIEAVTEDEADTPRVRRKVRQMLDKVYYQMRNLGQSPPDRAINFHATNAFVFASAVTEGLLSGRTEREDSDLYSLDTITAVKSPYCRVDSDCWDVQISFFDPDNDNRARVVFQSTIDVSDKLPVALAPPHQFLFRN